MHREARSRACLCFHPVSIIGVFTRQETLEQGSEHRHAYGSTHVLSPMQIIGSLFFVPKTYPKTSHKEHGKEYARTSIENSFFKPKVRVSKREAILILLDGGYDFSIEQLEVDQG